jgi:hypothetical protein
VLRWIHYRKKRPPTFAAIGVPDTTAITKVHPKLARRPERRTNLDPSSKPSRNIADEPAVANRQHRTASAGDSARGDDG